MILGRRALNRALLARQLLLDRHAIPAADVVEHLVGVQAQNPKDPYLALWSRVEGFDHEELSTLVAERGAVRVPLMRATIHLVTAADLVAIRPVVQSVCERTLRSTVFAKDTADVDRDELLAFGRRLIEEEPMMRAQLGQLLAERWPDVPAASLAQVVTYLLPVVQVPPRGLWQDTGPAAWTTAQHWLGRSPADDAEPDRLVLRYLAAFGPAATKDVRVWSGLTGLAEVIDRLRPQLAVFRDESGSELFDLPDAPRPDPDTPAPPRFLPEYDNVLLAHADRSRIIEPGHTSPGWAGNLLIDGFLRGSWKIASDRRAATLDVRLPTPITKREREGVTAEGDALLSFTNPETERCDIRIDLQS